MGADPVVSVVIVNYNSGSMLASCIQALIASTIEPEIIVVDNASTDDSILMAKLVANEGAFRVIENLRNLGFAKANNVAIKVARGRYILFLNPDNIVQSDTLQRMVELMKQNLNAGMAGCVVLNPDGTEQRGCRRNEPRLINSMMDMFPFFRSSGQDSKKSSYDQRLEPLPVEVIEVDAISGSFMFTEKSAVEKVGPMDEGYFLHCEDLDWCKRFRRKGYSVIFVPYVKATHYQGSCSTREPIKVSWYKHKGMVRYYNKFREGFVGLIAAPFVVLGIWAHFFLRMLLLGISTAQHNKKQLPDIPKPVLGMMADMEAPPHTVVVLTGASSLIGGYLIPRLVHNGYRVMAVSRTPWRRPDCAGLQWFKTLSSVSVSLSNSQASIVLINLAPIWLLKQFIQELGCNRLRQIIAFSSTSVQTKIQSSSSAEKGVADRLKSAELNVTEITRDRKIPLTLFRPTMIYGGGRDKNVSAIARIIDKLGFFLLIGKGSGMRQPVHADDLSKACMLALDNSKTFNKAYNLSGAEALSYRTMVLKIFDSLHKTPRIYNVPLVLLKTIIATMRYFPGFRYLTPQMADRLNMDMQFDHSDATTAFAYQPRKFLED